HSASPLDAPHPHGAQDREKVLLHVASPSTSAGRDASRAMGTPTRLPHFPTLVPRPELSIPSPAGPMDPPSFHARTRFDPDHAPSSPIPREAFQSNPVAAPASTRRTDSGTGSCRGSNLSEDTALGQ